MRTLLNYILNMIDYCIQEISYLPSDLKRWRKMRADDRAAGDRMRKELRQ